MVAGSAMRCENQRYGPAVLVPHSTIPNWVQSVVVPINICDAVPPLPRFTAPLTDAIMRNNRRNIRELITTGDTIQSRDDDSNSTDLVTKEITENEKHVTFPTLSSSNISLTSQQQDERGSQEHDQPLESQEELKEGNDKNDENDEREEEPQDTNITPEIESLEESKVESEEITKGGHFHLYLDYGMRGTLRSQMCRRFNEEYASMKVSYVHPRRKTGRRIEVQMPEMTPAYYTSATAIRGNDVALPESHVVDVLEVEENNYYCTQRNVTTILARLQSLRQKGI